MGQKTYHAPGIRVDDLASKLEKWFNDQKYRTQTLPFPDGLAVQAQSQKNWLEKQAVALTVKLAKQDDMLLVETGGAKWGVLAAGGVAAAIIFWPLLAIPGYAGYKQKEILDQVEQFIESYVATHQKPEKAAQAPVEEAPTRACPACGKSVPEGSKFCPNCGQKMEESGPKRCPECGAEVSGKFCANCGKPVDNG